MTTTILNMKCEVCEFEIPFMQEEWSADQALAAGISLGGFLQAHRHRCLGRMADQPVVKQGAT